MKYKLNDLVPETTTVISKSPAVCLKEPGDMLKRESMNKMILKFRNTGKFGPSEKINQTRNSLEVKPGDASPSKTFYNSRLNTSNFSGSKAINDLELSIRDSYALKTTNGKFSELKSKHLQQRSLSSNQILLLKDSTPTKSVRLMETVKKEGEETITVNMK